jgi:hypothetical protein
MTFNTAERVLFLAWRGNLTFTAICILHFCNPSDGYAIQFVCFLLRCLKGRLQELCKEQELILDTDPEERYLKTIYLLLYVTQTH